MAKGNGSLESEFYCTFCGNKGIPIQRAKGRGREAGHLKKLYCLTCKRETNHVECKEFTHYSKEDFFFEFENDNFTEEGKRKLEYTQFRDMMSKKGVDLP